MYDCKYSCYGGATGTTTNLDRHGDSAKSEMITCGVVDILISSYMSDNPEPFIDERISIFTMHVFAELTVFSADLDMNRFILQNKGKLLDCGPPRDEGSH
ncbi:CYP90A15 protein [Spatholobus suberectus]|nr:CYP90A15 protein [Spatholobus suberectus]